jgi:hypothetical protein
LQGRNKLTVLWEVITRAQSGMAEITVSHLRKNEGYKEPGLVEGFEESATRLAFREHQRQS